MTIERVENTVARRPTASDESPRLTNFLKFGAATCGNFLPTRWSGAKNVLSGGTPSFLPAIALTMPFHPWHVIRRQRLLPQRQSKQGANNPRQGAAFPLRDIVACALGKNNSQASGTYYQATEDEASHHTSPKWE
jgi:hypothetical protein